MANVNAQIIKTLFTAFNQGDNVQRMAIYSELLKDFPSEVLRLACRKAMYEQKFLPSIAEITESIKSLMGTVNEDSRDYNWQEAWKEIVKKMYSTPWGKKPTFSRPEIEEAVNAFGWEALQTIEASKFTTASAQVRRFYEDACKRSNERVINKFVLEQSETMALGQSRSQSEKTLASGDTSNGINKLNGSEGM